MFFQKVKQSGIEESSPEHAVCEMTGAGAGAGGSVLCEHAGSWGEGFSDRVTVSRFETHWQRLLGETLLI